MGNMEMQGGDGAMDHADGMGDMDMGDMDMGEGVGDVASQVKAYLGDTTCLVADIDELQDAVEVRTNNPQAHSTNQPTSVTQACMHAHTHTYLQSPRLIPYQSPPPQNGVCPLVVLTSGEKGAYMLMDMGEIMVRRRVRVMGHPALLPTIDAMMGMRAFTVGPGGYLELQFVRVRASMGMYRDRYGLEGREGFGTKVLEVRGGAVMLEPGALGANFVGVVFLMVVRAFGCGLGFSLVFARPSTHTPPPQPRHTHKNTHHTPRHTHINTDDGRGHGERGDPGHAESGGVAHLRRAGVRGGGHRALPQLPLLGQHDPHAPHRRRGLRRGCPGACVCAYVRACVRACCVRA